MWSNQVRCWWPAGKLLGNDTAWPVEEQLGLRSQRPVAGIIHLQSFLGWLPRSV